MNVKNIQDIKETICNAGLIILVIITVPALVISLLRIPTIGWQPIMGVHIVCVSFVVLLAVFRKHFSYFVRAATIVAIIFIVGAAELFNFGIIGAGGAYLAHAAIITAILLGRKHSLVLFSICSLVMLLVYFAYEYDIAGVADLDIIPYSKDLSAWGNFYFDYLLIWASTIAAFFYINSALLHSLNELDKYNASLEEKVAERTAELVEQNRRTEKALFAERQAIKSNLNFVDMISHEYRTPLSVIMSSLDLLESDDNIQNHEDTKAVLKRMSVSAARLLGLFELSLSEKRINESNILLASEKTDLINNVISVAADFYRHIYPDHRIIIDDSLWQDNQLIIDRELMVTAVSNLLDNACKYSEPSLVKIILKTEAKAAIITVRDTGKGIPERDMEYVCEKYYRSESTENKPGAGVGLYLVRKIAQLHHGRILVESKLTEGSSISIFLPI